MALQVSEDQARREYETLYSAHRAATIAQSALGHRALRHAPGSPELTQSSEMQQRLSAVIEELRLLSNMALGNLPQVNTPAREFEYKGKLGAKFTGD